MGEDRGKAGDGMRQRMVETNEIGGPCGHDLRSSDRSAGWHLHSTRPVSLLFATNGGDNISDGAEGALSPALLLAALQARPGCYWKPVAAG